MLNLASVQGESGVGMLRGMETIGQRLRYAREMADKKQEHLAAALGVTREAISQIERGVVKDPSIGRITALAAVCDVDPSWLAFGTGSPLGGAYRASEGQKVDTELLSAIVEIVSTILVRRKKTLSPHKLGLLVARIYEIEADRHGKSVDERNIQSLLELTL